MGEEHLAQRVVTATLPFAQASGTPMATCTLSSSFVWQRVAVTRQPPACVLRINGENDANEHENLAGMVIAPGGDIGMGSPPRRHGWRNHRRVLQQPDPDVHPVELDHSGR